MRGSGPIGLVEAWAREASSIAAALGMRPTLIRAKAAFLASGFLEDVGVVCQGGRIAGCGSFVEVATKHPVSRVVDLGEMVLLPGLVNAHVHLELTGLRGRAPFSGSFADWLGAVGAYIARAPGGELRRGVAAGAEEALQTGTTVVGDVALRCPAYGEMRRRGLGGVSFLEVLGLRRRVANGLLRWRQWQTLWMRPDGRVRVGLSPHAPYSTSAEAYRSTLALAESRKMPVMTHVAETRAEAELMERGTGELAALMEEKGWLPEGVKWQAPGMSPVECLNEVGFLRKGAMLAHVNYPSPGDLQRIADAGASVVFCPQSHRHFGHEEYPLLDMLRLGINVALGTDSLASNESLSMLAEAQLVRNSFPDVPPLVLLDMVTANGTKALGLGEVAGQIREGYWSDMIAVPYPPGLPGARGQRILDWVFSEAPPVKRLR